MVAILPIVNLLLEVLRVDPIKDSKVGVDQSISSIIARLHQEHVPSLLQVYIYLFC